MTAPGHPALGRGVVVAAGAEAPAAWAGAERVVVDALGGDDDALETLERCWSTRTPVVVDLRVDAEGLKQPEVEPRAPYLLEPSFDFVRERLHFLVWANTYDARKGEPVWWHGVRAARVDGRLTVGGEADVVLADGTAAWCDGGPREPSLGIGAVVHRDSIDAGRLTVARHRPPSADLAPDQLAAVAHGGGPARIIAPAGSGKTRVLTERLRHLIADRGEEPELITAVAYNVRAANELRERTAGFTPTIRTLNSLGLWVCRMAADVRVAEEREVRDILDRLVKLRRRVNADPVVPYIDALSAIRLGLVHPEGAEQLFPDASGVALVFDAFRAELRDRGAVDFDEQIYLALELLLRDPAVRARARATCRTLLVDEFQDLTPAHLLLIRLLAGPAASVFGVGDDDQTIYSFGGATPEFLIDFARYFPGAATHDLRVNYRCPVGVVDGARTLLGYNRVRIAKEIHAAPGRLAAADDLVVRRVPSSQVAPAARDQIAAWLDAGCAPTDIALLTRVNSILLPPQVLLTVAGIPCNQAVGLEILNRTGIRAALAYLRAGLRPGRIERADIHDTVRRPSRKIRPNVIDMMTKRARTSIDELHRMAGWLKGDDAERVASYADDIDVVTKVVSGGDTAAVLKAIRDQVGLGGAMSALDSSRGAADRSTHGDDLWALEQVAALHSDPATFERWLREQIAASAGEADGVHLSTVHRVKGMEWPNIVVSGASADLFPHRLAEDVEEERRVFHVAVTRARSSAVVIGDAGAPSPFLDELTGLAKAPAARAPVPPKPVVVPAPGALAGDVAVRFEALRAWRTDRARRAGMPAYIVMSDAHLRGIAERNPTTPVQLSRCPGIGPKKLDEYGDEILAVLESSTPLEAR